MSKTTKKIKFLKKKLTVKSLSPIDFSDCAYWPFCYYVVDSNTDKKTKWEQPERDWKVKPKKDQSIEDKLNESIKSAFIKGLDISSELYDEMKKDEIAHNFILNEIYAQSYGLSSMEKFFSPQKVINREFAEGIAVKSKAMSKEPYSFLVNVDKEKPELYNPKRYDFNYFILGVLWEMEAREYEKAMKEAKKQSKLKTRR